MAPVKPLAQYWAVKAETEYTNKKSLVDVKLSSRSQGWIKYFTIYLSTASSLDHGKKNYLSLRSPFQIISTKREKTSKPTKPNKDTEIIY